MLKALVILSCLVGLGLSDTWDHWSYWGGYPAGGYYGGAYPFGGFPWGGLGYPWGNRYYGQVYGQGYAPYNRLVFYGKFQGTCEKAHDGIYFVDERSFAYCSNGKKTIQPCAEGSANPPVAHFKHGDYYALYDFCSINLVAKGYTGTGYDEHPPKPNVEGYGEPAPVYEETREYGYHETSYDQPPKAEYGKPKY